MNTITIHGKIPSKSNCYRMRCVGKQAMLYKTQAIIDYEQSFFLQCPIRNLKLDKYFELDVDVYYENMRPDLDNCFKVLDRTFLIFVRARTGTRKRILLSFCLKITTNSCIYQKKTVPSNICLGLHNFLPIFQSQFPRSYCLPMQHILQFARKYYKKIGFAFIVHFYPHYYKQAPIVGYKMYNID